MKKVALVFLFLSLTFLCGQVIHQEYPLGKVTLDNGIIIEGKELLITKEKVSITVGGSAQSFDISNVVQIMAKQGKGKKFGGYCAGGCIGVSFGLYGAAGGKGVDEDGNEVDIPLGAYAASSLLYGALSYGIGYLAGIASDSWQLVYFKTD